MAENKFACDFLGSTSDQYFGDGKGFEFEISEALELPDIALYRVDEITYEEKSPRKEALENVISSLNIDGVNFIYLILGDRRGVHFYFGVVNDLKENRTLELEVNDIGSFVLAPSLKGNFRGSIVSEVPPAEKKSVLHVIQSMGNYCYLEGVPGINKDDENFQGVDRLIDVMLGDEFGLMIIAKPLNMEEIFEIEKNIYNLYSSLTPISKRSVQDGTNHSRTRQENISKGINSSESENTSTANQKGTGISNTDQKGWSRGTDTSQSKTESSGSSSSSSATCDNNGVNEGTNTSKSIGETTNLSETKTTGTSLSRGTSDSKTEGTSDSEGASNAETVEFVDKKLQDWLKYMDEIIIPRIDYGKGKGMFVSAAFLFARNKANLVKLGNTVRSLYSGENGNKMPLKTFRVKDEARLKSLKNFQLPYGRYKTNLAGNEIYARTAFSQYVNEKSEFCIGNWMSTRELSLIAGLPQKEIVGLRLREEVEFGLNCGINGEDSIHLGKLVQSGNVLENINVTLDKENINKHIFVTGVTGSGKTTTCQKLLIDSGLPFLVIEPAKTEYRALMNKFPDMLVFTLGKDSVAPFRLNPFEIFPHESITSRVDMIKASIEASFDMEAAIPQLIESAIYRCYEDYGWNIATNRNMKYDDPFADGVYAFPTLGDLVSKTGDVVSEQGFDERLKNDYIGSIKARLQGLLAGSKGFMLNTHRSIDFEQLIERRVVLELEEIRSASEKSLIMGFVLTNLVEALKAKYQKEGPYKHITLIEEAHRLLSKYMPGDSMNKKQGVEVFTDILAEVRKYGESLIIVDQIPGKLTTEVLKNTNTKFVHRIFAQDDKEAIGNTIALSQEQKEYLSGLETGRAIVFTQGWHKAVQISIDQISYATENVSDVFLRKNIMEFYCSIYKKGIFQGLECLEEMPSAADMEYYISLLQDDALIRDYEMFVQECRYNERMEITLRRMGDSEIVFLSEYFAKRYYSCGRDGGEQEMPGRIRRFFQAVADGFDSSERSSFFRELKTIGL